MLWTKRRICWRGKTGYEMLSIECWRQNLTKAVGQSAINHIFLSYFFGIIKREYTITWFVDFQGLYSLLYSFFIRKSYQEYVAFAAIAAIFLPCGADCALLEKAKRFTFLDGTCTIKLIVLLCASRFLQTSCCYMSGQTWFWFHSESFIVHQLILFGRKSVI